MPFERPELTVIRQRVSADIERHSGESASQRGDTYYPMAQAVASVSHGLHGHIAYNAEQIFDKTADDENLLRRAAEMGVYRIEATRASGAATITGTEAAIIPAETLLQDDAQKIYRVTEQAVIASGTATLQLKSLEVGTDQNQDVGTTLRLINSVLDIDTTATVVDISGGADIESIDRIRDRLSERRKNPPMGGAPHDYVAWAKAAHVDVTRAWVYENTPYIGSVTVHFVTDHLSTLIPTPTHVAAVQAYTDTVRPAGMRGFIAASLTPKPLDITFTKLVPNNPATQAAVIAELKDLIIREAKPGGTLLLSHINEAISIATGETDHAIDLTEDFTCLPHEFPEVGDITWP